MGGRLFGAMNQAPGSSAGASPSGNIINGNELVFEKGPKTELITEELQIFGEALDGRLGWSM